MSKKKPIFYNALLLTGVNLLLRFVGTSFQVFLSGRVGAEGIGMLQLVLSVGALAMTFGMGGIRTATMYLCAEVVGQKRQERMIWVVSACVTYSLILSIGVASVLYYFAPHIAKLWIGHTETIGAIRLLAGFIPANCLCGVMVGHFTGINRIGTLAIIEVAEQLISMLLTVLLLTLWAGSNSTRACLCVILGSGIGASFTLLCLLFLKKCESAPESGKKSIAKKLWQTAVPLAIADDVKAGISTTENLMVPKRLALYTAEISPLASFGMVSGMVFPVLMFPASIIFGLAELLIPELARCNAAGSTERIRHLAQRSLLLALVYGAFCGGLLFIGAEPICTHLYRTPEAGKYLQWFAALAPMLYCDAIVDAISKGLGQQKICVRYNIFTSALDVALLYFLLPRCGIEGYFFSFLISHLINFFLSIRLLIQLVGKIASIRTGILITAAAFAGVAAASSLPGRLKVIGFTLVFSLLLTLFGIIRKEDMVWVKNLIVH